MWLTEQKCLVPRQWMHNYDIKNIWEKSLKDIMIENIMPIPQHWNDINKMSIFDKAYFGIIPNINGHQSDEQDEYGFTVAMLLAMNSIIIPKQWRHNPKLQNNYGQTVIMIQVSKNFIPSRYWMHSYNIRDKKGRSLRYYFDQQDLPAPHYWRNDMTAIDRACFGEIPKLEQNDPSDYNNEGLTVAMVLAALNKIIPQEWHHDTSLQDDECNTVAMYQAKNGKIPDKEWEHQPNLQNYDGDTVTIILADQGIIPPKQWKHTPSLHNLNNQSVPCCLLDNDILPNKDWEYIINEQELYNYQKEFLLNNNYSKLGIYYIPPNYNIIQKQNNTCQICLQEGDQDFLRTKCGHKICFQCFQQLGKNIDKCPMCKQEDWIQPLLQE